MGAPSTFDSEKALEICEIIATSNKSLRKICEQDGMPSVRAVLYWLSEGGKENPQEHFRSFLQQYAHARELQADFLAEEIIEISEHTDEDHTAFTGINVVQRDRLRIDARKWVASKLKPKKYGDKVDLTTQGEKINSVPIQVEIVKPKEDD